MNSRTAGLTLLLVSAVLARADGPLVKIVGVPAVGKSLVVEITSPGPVGVENGLRLVSESVKGAGPRQVVLGQVEKIGFYQFRFFDSTGARLLLLPVLVDGALVAKAPGLSPKEDQALEKLLRLHSRAALLEAWGAWPAREELAKNIVSVTTVGTLALACPFEGLSCGPAVAGALDLTLDFTIAFEEFFAEYSVKKGLLTKEDLASVKGALLAAKTTKSVLSVKGKLDAALATVEFFTALSSNRDVQFSLGLLTDEVKKTKTLIIVFRRP